MSINPPSQAKLGHNSTPIRVLEQIPLFHGLSEAELVRIGAGLTSVRLPGRAMLITEVHWSDQFSILIKGAVKVQIEQPNGSSVVVTVLGSGQVLSELSHVDGLRCAVTIETLEPSVLLSMSVGHYQHLLHTIPTLSANVMHQLTQRLCLANQQIMALATFGAEGRVAAQIHALAAAYAQPGATGLREIPFRLTQITLAALTGLSRVRVNQVLQRFHAEQIIGLDPQYHLRLYDDAALIAYAAAPRIPTH